MRKNLKKLVVLGLVGVSFGGAIVPTVSSGVVYAEEITSSLTENGYYYTSSDGITRYVYIDSNKNIFVDGQLVIEIKPIYEDRSVIWDGNWMYNVTVRTTRSAGSSGSGTLKAALSALPVVGIPLTVGFGIESIKAALSKPRPGEYLIITMWTRKDYKQIKMVTERFLNSDYSGFVGTDTNIIDTGV
ncbi:hypothetical protein GMA11_06240 [Granulicatella sp. zg-ZJ]|uniref:hypothetical protein n=1 Tax=Granulicatella sp. zg-ZJ TaxID=2678504 RepID=UPI0013D11CBC|nr:hypothetical protein [Granulicatella sp. zg-ZJ]NEW62445.1 hypothetical protein [Granulicatella sp. zg-ZJ]NEW62991.1 hypothetical protein [Granulicatella sp. zg-ZJ]